jgi:hypothetical protein
VPGRRGKCARTGTPSGNGSFWRHYLRQEPGAVVPHAGICAGGAGKPASLPRHILDILPLRPYSWVLL